MVCVMWHAAVVDVISDRISSLFVAFAAEAGSGSLGCGGGAGRAFWNEEDSYRV